VDVTAGRSQTTEVDAEWLASLRRAAYQLACVKSYLSACEPGSLIATDDLTRMLASVQERGTLMPDDASGFPS
jgi:hypothetical protein